MTTEFLVDDGLAKLIMMSRKRRCPRHQSDDAVVRPRDEFPLQRLAAVTCRRRSVAEGIEDLHVLGRGEIGIARPARRKASCFTHISERPGREFRPFPWCCREQCDTGSTELHLSLAGVGVSVGGPPSSPRPTSSPRSSSDQSTSPLQSHPVRSISYEILRSHNKPKITQLKCTNLL